MGRQENGGGGFPRKGRGGNGGRPERGGGRFRGRWKKHGGGQRRGGKPRFGFAERENAPAVPPVPQDPPPAAFAANVFGSLDERLQYAIADMGYAVPTPIQERAIPHLLEGRDLIGCAQTGTGKTAAFLLPALDKLLKKPAENVPGSPRVLVLSPTRELAAQTAENDASYSKYTGTPFAVVFGGVSQFRQVQALERGAQVVIATPGRLMDLMSQGAVRLDAVETFVLDEADRMLDMGFLPDVKRIIARLPEERQSLLFSATLAPEIIQLAGEIVRDPVQISVDPGRPAADKINQRVMFAAKEDKDALLVHILETHPEWFRTIVFARTRRNADRIERKLRKAGIEAAALHSDKSQLQRTRALEGFRKGDIRVLVATDIASRGIDVRDVALVVNMEFPDEPESYIHRIGRTARAGESGCAITFTAPDEAGKMRAVEKLLKMRIERDKDQPFHSEAAEKAAERPGGRSSGGPRRDGRPGWSGAGADGFRNEDGFRGKRGHGRGGRPFSGGGGGGFRKNRNRPFGRDRKGPRGGFSGGGKEG